MLYVALDTETDLIGPGNVIPNLICMTNAVREANKSIATSILGNGDPELPDTIEMLLGDPDISLVFHNAAFDLTVICKKYPQFFPLVFSELEAGRIFDTVVREKLLNLSTTGDLKFAYLPDGSKRPVEYHLVDLETKYLGWERQAQKTGDDIWRLNFKELDGHKAAGYPEEASSYAQADAEGTLAVFFEQEVKKIGEAGPGSMKTQELHVAADFSLKLMTGWGLAVNQEEKAKVKAMVERELAPEKLNLLLESGVLRAGEKPRPYKNGATNKDGTPKMTKAKKESVDTKKLEDLVKSVSETFEIDVIETPTGHVATSAAVIMELTSYDPILAQFAHRQNLQKIVTTELPRMGDGGTVHPMFDVLKETGRTSSYGSDLHPSANVQNVDYRVRGCYEAREGCVILSSDFSGIELVCLGQKLHDLFGGSRLGDLINDGVDPHAFLGAALAYNFNPDFREECAGEGVKSEEDVYKVFLACKTSETEEVRAFFKHWRTFAKPTGLGFPGGLGPKTFVTYAKATFGVDVTIEMAHQFRQVWHATYPEMKNYFEWINQHCEDPDNAQCYAYSSPLGMYRAGATYCAAANGAALQSPAAEGGKVATFDVMRACYDLTQESPLLGCHGLGFIHDELLMEIPRDEFMHERACTVADTMVNSMSAIITDVRVSAEPALMLKWDKRAEPVYDENGRLTIWVPQH